VYAGGASAWVLAQGRLLLRSTAAMPIPQGHEPRLRRVLSGIASDLGVPEPVLRLVPDDGPNAFLCPAGGLYVGVTRSLLESYTLTELEAVVAHCLMRVNRGELWRTTLAVARGPLAGPLGAGRDGIDDVGAAALTRYPPALASAIRKARPRGGRFAPFWFVGEDATRTPAGERARDVLDL
jgi:hypothetical protein